MSSELIEVRGLARHYGRTRALNGVSLTIEQGAVVGLIGRNGAGKTTLIRHLLGLLRAQTGSVRVFDRDPAREPARVLDKIGYVSEERDLPAWMTLRELLRYTSAFYPGWDENLATRLCRDFELDLRQKVGSLSRGQHVRASLALAIAPRPPILILDEPSSGLDPVVRRDVLETVLSEVAADGRTVLFSSHLLDEVERISSHLIMIDRGEIRFDDPALDVLDRFLLLEVAATGTRPPELPEISRWLPLSAEGNDPAELTVLCELRDAAAASHLGERLATREVRLLEQQRPSLEEVFVHLCDAPPGSADGAR